jgi:TRAP-type C4-dicarboxylate transport system permease small subunit
MLENREAKNWNNVVLGLLVAVLPWLGLPAAWKNIFLLVGGILIVLFSLARLKINNHHDSEASPAA